RETPSAITVGIECTDRLHSALIIKIPWAALKRFPSLHGYGFFGREPDVYAWVAAMSWGIKALKKS
ncbi:hypothetical protein PJN11_28885, partial [Mycobacterium kansasii]